MSETTARSSAAAAADVAGVAAWVVVAVGAEHSGTGGIGMLEPVHHSMAV